jgi:hypothetical protein
MICAQVHTQCHKCYARYTLGARYLYFERNAEKFEVRVIRKVRAIGRKIRYLYAAVLSSLLHLITSCPQYFFFKLQLYFLNQDQHLVALRILLAGIRDLKQLDRIPRWQNWGWTP